MDKQLEALQHNLKDAVQRTDVEGIEFRSHAICKCL